MERLDAADGKMDGKYYGKDVGYADVGHLSCNLVRSGQCVPLRTAAWGGGSESGLVVLRGRAKFTAPKAPEKTFRCSFPCVGQSVGGWVPLELTLPPPPPFPRG